MDDELREKLAELEHEQWAHWTVHMLAALAPLMSPVRLVGTPEYDTAKENLERWSRQVGQSYTELSDKEKDSDRVWADKVLAVLRRQSVLTLDETVQAARNLGHDITCGRCAAEFYTGSGGQLPHDEACQSVDYDQRDY